MSLVYGLNPFSCRIWTGFQSWCLVISFYDSSLLQKCLTDRLMDTTPSTHHGYVSKLLILNQLSCPWLVPGPTDAASGSTTLSPHPHTPSNKPAQLKNEVSSIVNRCVSSLLHCIHVSLTCVLSLSFSPSHRGCMERSEEIMRGERKQGNMF